MTAKFGFVRRIGIRFVAVVALVAPPLAAVPRQARTAGTGVVINEVYLSGVGVVVPPPTGSSSSTTRVPPP